MTRRRVENGEEIDMIDSMLLRGPKSIPLLFEAA